MSRAGEKRRIALGLCANCGHGPRVTQRFCMSCRDKRRIYDNDRNRNRVKSERTKEGERLAQKRRYDRHRAAGTCTRCAKRAALPERRLCADCQDLNRELQKARQKSAKTDLVIAPRPMLTQLPKPSRPLGLPPPQVSRLGWCPPKGSIALGMIWNGK